jgi:long-chain acyl-CoA synthetase
MNRHQSDTLGFLMDQITSRHPNREALVCVGEYRSRRFTFSDIDRLIQQTTQWLKGQGLCPGDRVILCGFNSAELLVLLLSCGVSGLVAVPVDLNCSHHAFDRVVKASQASLVATSRLDLLELVGRRVPSFALQCLFDEVRRKPEAAQAVTDDSVQADDLLCLFFTSGTTGDPKGVRISHRNVVSNVRHMNQIESLDRKDRLLNMAPLSHALGLTIGLLIPWYANNTAIIAADLAPSRMVKLLTQERVSAIATVPVFLERAREKIESTLESKFGPTGAQRLLREALRLPLPARRQLFRPVRGNFAPHLRWIASGGAALNNETDLFWEALGVEVVQGYGLTETLIATCSGFADRRKGSVGRPLPNQPLCLSDSGEILLRGPNVTQGYVDAPKDNEAAFRDGWFCTGDVGKIDDDGYVFIVGREKNVIIGPSGINIYPEDVELALNTHPLVREAVVFESPTHPGQLWATVIPSSCDDELELHTVRSEVNSRLSSHQRLQRLLLWPEQDFPRTPVQKVIRRKVAAAFECHEMRTPPPEEDVVAATCRDETDSIAALIAQVANVGHGAVDPQSMLGADLGLDSLALCELLALVEAQTGRTVKAEQLFAHDLTAADFQAIVEQGNGSVEEPCCVEWQDGPVTKTAQTLSRRLFPTAFRQAFELTVKGAQHVEELGQERYLLIANHQSHLDWMSVWTALPESERARLSPAAAYDYFYAGRSRGTLFLLHSLAPFLPWRRTASPRTMIAHVGERLDQGHNVLVFPEGTRSRTGELGEFKATIGFLVRELNVPVVPVFLTGTYELWPPHQRWPQPGRIDVTFGRAERFSWHDEPHHIRDRLHSLYS